MILSITPWARCLIFSAWNTLSINAGQATEIDMKSVALNEGEGRTRLSLSAYKIGNDLVVCLFNQHGHIGAVAVADYHAESGRTSTSVITRAGHKDDLLAVASAYRICKRLKAPVCVIAGVHVDRITKKEITQIKRNCERLVDRFLQRYF